MYHTIPCITISRINFLHVSQIQILKCTEKSGCEKSKQIFLVFLAAPTTYMTHCVEHIYSKNKTEILNNIFLIFLQMKYCVMLQ